jgi:Type I phosphodiesterase / nucleotide pyrophosphatase
MKARARTKRLMVVAVACGLIGCRSTTARPITTPATRAAAAAATAGNDTDQRQRWLEMFARGYFPGRSGQIFYVPREGDFVVDKNPVYRFMHGSPWSYDTRIPLLFHGAPFIRRGEWKDAVMQQDVAPTLAAILGLTPPATMTGRALQQVLNGGAERPRVVALIVLDGMRADYFDTYRDVMPTLIRLRREGAWFSDARVNFLPTQTSVGHATLGTGTDPRFHGLAANQLFNRVTGESQEAYDGLDPRELMALTLADQWNITTDGKAVIIGQGGAIRATAGLVGHGSCVINGRKVIAASFASDAGWETNPDCYTLSEALKPINGKRYWEEAGGTWMGHSITSTTTFRASGIFPRFEADALIAVIEREAIGTDEVTDLVLVNFKSSDYVAHAFGPASPEIKAALTELDRHLARVLSALERKTGPNRSVVAISADHGMPGEPGPGQRRLFNGEIADAVNQRFDPGARSVVQYYGDAANAQMHLDTARLRLLGFSLKDVATFLEAQNYFVAAFTEDEVRAAQSKLPALK